MCRVMKRNQVVTSFLEFKGRILLLRRSCQVGTYRGKWSGVSGYLEEGEEAYSQAVKEIWEEAGLDERQVKLVKSGLPLTIIDREIETLWVVHPFLFKTRTDNIKIDWESQEAKWVNPHHLNKHDTVPMLAETLNRVKEYGKIGRRIAKQIENIKRDRQSGASQLARQAALTLKIAAETCKAANTPEYIRCLDTVGNRLKMAHSTMAPITNIVGQILRATLEEKGKTVTPVGLRRLIKVKTDEFISLSEKALSDAACEASELIPNNSVILTHSYSSTVIDTFKHVYQAGRHVKSVIVTESRPLREGVRTAELLSNLEIPVTFIIDSAARSFIEKADLVLVGADSILSDGSIVNKIGTALLALAAYEQQIPIYAVCETLKFNLKSFLGEKVELETKDPSEVLNRSIHPKISVQNFYFDITPSKYVSGIITEKCLIKPADISRIMGKMLENYLPLIGYFSR